MKKKKLKAQNYVVSYSLAGHDREILMMLNKVAKYMVEYTENLLKAPTETTKWEWKKGRSK